MGGSDCPRTLQRADLQAGVSGAGDAWKENGRQRCRAVKNVGVPVAWCEMSHFRWKEGRLGAGFRLVTCLTCLVRSSMGSCFRADIAGVCVSAQRGNIS